MKRPTLHLAIPRAIQRAIRARHLPALCGVLLLTLSVAVMSVVGLVQHPSAPPPAVTAAAAAPVARTVPDLTASRSRPEPTALPVAHLKRLAKADLLLTTKRPLTAKQVAQLKAITGVRATSFMSTGGVRVAGLSRGLNAMGVDPSTFRPFTPRDTARSDALWGAIAGNALGANYSAKLPLGRTVHVVGKHPINIRIGSVAAYDLPGTAIVVDREVARQLGLVQNTALLEAPERSLSRLENDVRDVVGPGVSFLELRPVKVTVNRRPATYRELYQLSARYCPGLSWTVLAAIGQVESDHGRDVGPSSAGALGPMQFLPSTWASYGVDGDADGKADIMSAYDAVPAASLYLCRNGAGRGGRALYDAIFNYNHADWYVRKVLAIAAQYK